jgi:hypothetical protein
VRDSWRVEASLASGNDRDRLAGAKLLLSELYEPGADREREREAEQADARGRVIATIDQLAARRIQSTLVERGLIRPGGAQSFEGVVMFDLRELAEWAGAWAARPVTVTDVSCAICGKAAVRLVAEGESVAGEAVYCETCVAVKAVEQSGRRV